MIFINYLRRTWQRIAIRLGFIKPPVRRHKPDELVDDVIDHIVNTSGAFIVAVETRQAMVKILSYMEKNGISSVGAMLSKEDIPSLGRIHSHAFVLQEMESNPGAYRVVVMTKAIAGTGWNVPQPDMIGLRHLLSTFHQRGPWATQYTARLHRCSTNQQRTENDSH